jgi:hypothetical protein
LRLTPAISLPARQCFTLQPAEECGDDWGKHSNMTFELHSITTSEAPNIIRLVPVERHLSAMRSQFIRGLLFGILVSAGVAILAFKYSTIRQQGTAVKEGPGQRALANSDAQTGPKPTPDVVGTPLVPPLPKPQPSKASNDFLDNPVAPVVVGDRPRSPVTLPVAQPAPLADPSLPESRPAKKTLVTPQQLWSSVKGGNTKAAVALADLYLRGDGVPVNCDQARVLLTVAAKANNAEAIKKLQELDDTGCPAP